MTISQNGGVFIPHKRRGPIAAEFSGPGPAAITLPTLFGNQGEETKSRSPAYSFGSKSPVKIEAVAPAPNVYNVAGLTSRGKDCPMAKTIAGKGKEPKLLDTPAPGTYNVDKSEEYLEGGIAYTMRIKPDLKIKSIAPAPGTYTPEKAGKDDGPKSSMHIKPKEPKVFTTPSPNAYKPEKSEKFLEKKSEIAFGLKHSPYLGSLKGDAWASPRTEMVNRNRKLSGTRPGTTTYTRTVTGPDGQTTTTTNAVTNGNNRLNVQEDFRPQSETFTKATGFASQVAV